MRNDFMPLDASERNRLNQLFAKGFKRMSEDEVREYQQLGERDIAERYSNRSAQS